MNSQFERFLISKGYIPFSADYSNDIFVGVIQSVQSSVNDLLHYYFHKDSPIIEKIKNKTKIDFIPENELQDGFIYGLSEKDKGPTLCYPRNFYKAVNKDKSIIFCRVGDMAINRILKIYSPQEIFDFIKEKKVIEIEIEL